MQPLARPLYRLWTGLLAFLRVRGVYREVSRRVTAALLQRTHCNLFMRLFQELVCSLLLLVLDQLCMGSVQCMKGGVADARLAQGSIAVGYFCLKTILTSDTQQSLSQGLEQCAMGMVGQQLPACASRRQIGTFSGLRFQGNLG